MQSRSGSGAGVGVFRGSGKAGTEAKRVLDRLATGVLLLVLALGAIITAIWLATWWDDTQTSFSVSAAKSRSAS